MWTRSELKEKAKVALKRSYGGLVLVCLILSFISGGGGGGGGGYNSVGNSNGNGSDNTNIYKFMRDFASGNLSAEEMTAITAIFGVVAAVILIVILISLLLTIFVFQPLQIGCYRYLEEACYNKMTVGDIDRLGHCFKKGRYGNTVKTMFLMNLYLVLWTLLLIIPGLIKTYEYRMIPYILAENPTIDSKKAFQLSKEMMNGNKWAAFVLDLSFIGWIFVGIISCCIGYVFYVLPYIMMTDAYLYDTLKQNASFDYFDHTLGGNQAAYAGGGYYGGGYDAGGYNAGGYDAGSYDAGSYDAGSYDDSTYDTGSYDNGGYDDNNNQ